MGDAISSGSGEGQPLGLARLGAPRMPPGAVPRGWERAGGCGVSFGGSVFSFPLCLGWAGADSLSPQTALSAFFQETNIPSSHHPPQMVSGTPAPPSPLHHPIPSLTPPTPKTPLDPSQHQPTPPTPHPYKHHPPHDPPDKPPQVQAPRGGAAPSPRSCQLPASHIAGRPQEHAAGECKHELKCLPGNSLSRRASRCNLGSPGRGATSGPPFPPTALDLGRGHIPLAKGRKLFPSGCFVLCFLGGFLFCFPFLPPPTPC